MQDNLVPLYNRLVHIYEVILINIFHLWNDSGIFDHIFFIIFDQILVIFHNWIFSPERLTHFRDFEGTENVSIFPGGLYKLRWCWRLKKLGDNFLDVGVRITVLVTSSEWWYSLYRISVGTCYKVKDVGFENDWNYQKYQYVQHRFITVIVQW